MGDEIDDTVGETDDGGSLADHEASFGGPVAREDAKQAKDDSKAVEATAEGTDESTEPAQESKSDERDEQGRFKHRAKSQQAKPEDVPRIRELTKRLRDAEMDRDRWRSQIEQGNGHRADVRPDVGTPKPVQPEAKPSAGFTEPEPKLEQFDAHDDPYGSYLRAVTRWEARQERFEWDRQATEARTRAEQEAVRRAAAERVQEVTESYRSKLEPFVTSHPDFNDLMSQYGTFELSPLAQATLMLHDKGPDLVYYLLQHPDELAEMQLLTDGKAVSESTVATATRWLERRASAVLTGSAIPSVPKRTPPPPPNPVRTVPNRGDSTPTDDGSLAEHERAFSKVRR